MCGTDLVQKLYSTIRLEDGFFKLPDSQMYLGIPISILKSSCYTFGRSMFIVAKLGLVV